MGLIANVNVNGTWYGPAHPENEVTTEVRKQITNPEAFALEPIAAGGPPDGTADEVLVWVGDDRDRARDALEAEQERPKPRSTLIAALEPIAAGEPQIE